MSLIRDSGARVELTPTRLAMLLMGGEPWQLSRCTQIADFELEGHFTAVKSRTTKTSLRINRG
jgi:hypothetical protein